mgnify:FL=1
MTIKEAIRVKNANIDMDTGRKLEHSEIYGRAIDYLGGLEIVKRYIPYDLETLKEAYKKDEYFNNLSMRKWDMMAGFISDGARCSFVGGGIWDLYRWHKINSASCSDGVCILKEAARLWVEMEG